jgi:beta-RFAP synthase
VPPLRIEVERCPPEHVGLGTGTQLSLSVARAVAAAAGLPEPDVRELADRAGRGRRSAIGVHGFAQGGLLVEAGQRQPGSISPLVARTDFPSDWRVVLMLPPWERGRHGTNEVEAFAELSRRPIPRAQTDVLCRLVLLGLLPALAEADAPAFGEAVHEFNSRAGECFAAVQGGVYASPRIADLVAFLRGQGVPGAGQSSWGPAVFAVVADAEQAADVAGRVREHFGWGAQEVFVTRADNEGAQLREASQDR